MTIPMTNYPPCVITIYAQTSRLGRRRLRYAVYRLAWSHTCGIEIEEQCGWFSCVSRVRITVPPGLNQESVAMAITDWTLREGPRVGVRKYADAVVPRD
ncbi:hypothetical protein [Nocardia nova]